jgi:hypothetical protein
VKKGKNVASSVTNHVRGVINFVCHDLVGEEEEKKKK